MCASRRRTTWISGNVQNNYRNMADYVSRQAEFHAVGPATAIEDTTAKSSTMMWHSKVTAGWAKTLSTVSDRVRNANKSPNLLRNGDEGSGKVIRNPRILDRITAKS